MEETTDIRTKIIKAFSSDGCPLCAILRRDEFESLCQWVGSSTAESAMQIKKLTDAGGFCNYHFWRFREIASPYGIANIGSQLIDKLLIALRAHKPGHFQFTECPLCLGLRKKESAYLRELLVILKNSKHKSLYEKTCGLCIPHYMKIKDYIDDSLLMNFMYETQVAQLEKVKVDAIGFVNKRQPPMRWEQTEDEKKSWFRAIEKLVGRSGS